MFLSQNAIPSYIPGAKDVPLSGDFLYMIDCFEDILRWKYQKFIKLSSALFTVLQYDRALYTALQRLYC